MNRSFRAQESQMQAAFKQRQQQYVKEEELALFLEMKKREKERNDLLLHSSEELDSASGSNSVTSPIFNMSSYAPVPFRKTVADDFLNSENDKNDYDWLLTPPGTPLFPSLEMETRKTVMSQLGTLTARPTALKSRLANPQSEPTGRTNLVSKQPAIIPGLSSSSGATRRPSSSGGPGSRPGTPTGHLTSTTTSKSLRSSTPTRGTLPSTRTMVATSKTTISAAKPVVSANKTSTSAIKTTVPAAKPTIPSRSSAPLSRSTARSSTPTSRPTLPPSRSASRASTPTRRSSTPSREPSVSAPSVKTSSRQPSPMTSRQTAPVVSRQAAPVVSRQPTLVTSRQPVTVTSRQPATVASRQQATMTSRQPAPATSRQPAPVTSRQPVPSRGNSPTLRSRPWKPSEMPGFSLDAPPNLRTTLPERPLSAARGRPGAPSSRSSSVEPSSSGRPKRQSCSPSRGRSSNGTVHISGNSMPAVSRGHSKVNDNVSPVVMGTKMVERVINMRKLVPPRMDDKISPRGNLSGKSASSPDSSGFGRTLSKKSLDMAIRHMDIRRTIPGNLRPLMTNIPASSLFSVRSGSQRSRTVSVSSSPHATSSNASSELSVNQNGLCLDSSEVDDDVGSERCGQSPASVRGW
ncbi:PREDICTED: mucin-5AC-like [Lupinus angustifolius]|uniref:mucin-5AC-like n=1 Tax=Lupinus angustifolius TaxID=3871 RepID=UPI00092E97A8|nr:PREDICTED: mucin-5AC-like [Lupinus angustifolius]